MLSDSYLNPQVRMRDRQARTVKPINRAKWLGNDETGMTVHYDDIDKNTFNELKPVIHRNTTWTKLEALKPIECMQARMLRMSELVNPTKRSEFWLLYNTLRNKGFDRRFISEFIRQNATFE